MNKFQIWEEGYRVSGNSSDATMRAEIEAETFMDACNQFYKGNPDYRINPDGNPVIWGCRIYDNETDARKSFG